jgi:hypothetical protein
VALTFTRPAAVPPVTVMSSAAKLVPTSSLKVKVKVTAPVAVAPASLSVMATVGGVVSVGAVGSVPPQAASSQAVATAPAIIERGFLGWVMASFLLGWCGPESAGPGSRPPAWAGGN